MLPLALFFAAREKVSWRPQKVMQLPFGAPGEIVISPGDRFVANIGIYYDYSAPREEIFLVMHDLQSGREVEARGIYPDICVAAFDEKGRLAFGWREVDEKGNSKKLGVAVFSNGKLRDLQISKGVFPWDYPTHLRFSPDGKTLWMASADNLYSWDVASGKLKWRWNKEGGKRNTSLPLDSAISEDCRYYFRADSHFILSMWDIAKNKRLLVAKLPEYAGLDFSSDADLLVSEMSGVSVIESKTGRVLWVSPHSTAERPLTLVAETAIVRNANRFEVREARTGKFLRWLPAEGNVRVVTSESPDWLYTVNDRNELFRQRLR